MRNSVPPELDSEATDAIAAEASNEQRIVSPSTAQTDSFVELELKNNKVARKNKEKKPQKAEIPQIPDDKFNRKTRRWEPLLLGPTAKELLKKPTYKFVPETDDVEEHFIQFIDGIEQEMPSFCDAISVLAAPDPIINYVINKNMATDLVAVLVAPPGTGKSFFSMELGMSLASSLANELLLNLDINDECRGGTLYLNGEDSVNAFNRRFKAALKLLNSDKAVAEVSRYFRPYPLASQTVSLMSPRWVDYIVAKALKIENLKLVIIDTLSVWSAGCAENDATEMGELMSTIKKISQDPRFGENKPAVLIIHHPPKDAPKKALELSAEDPMMHEVMTPRGSSVIHGNCRWSGWLTKMSPVDAEINGIDPIEAKKYVAFGVSKPSGECPPDLKWFKKNGNGLLIADKHIGSTTAFANGLKEEQSQTRKERDKELKSKNVQAPKSKVKPVVHQQEESDQDRFGAPVSRFGSTAVWK